MNDLPIDRPRRPRADAERNRGRVLDAAREILAEKGAQARLEEIARAAGVGIGTLYRHFPTRETLLEEVYRADAERLSRAARALAEGQPVAREALRSWLRLFIELMGTRRGLAELVAGADPKPTNSVVTTEPSEPTARALVAGAISGLVAALEPREENGGLVEPMDLLRALVGVANTSAGPGWEDRAWHLADVLVAGLGGTE